MQRSFAGVFLCMVLASTAHAESRTTSGELWVEPATLIALGFEWSIQGDDNRNARVAVSYRKKGSSTWSRGFDLMRLQNEEVYTRAALDYQAPNMFAGSVFDLEEDTEYEVNLSLQDPDGVSGETSKTVTVRTRAEPQPAKDGRVFHVYPPGYKGPTQEPAFFGLLEAYYMGALGADWSHASPPRVKAGDTIVVHAGLYLSKHERYSQQILARGTECCGTPWDGTYYLTQKGTAERPIAIVAAGDGEVIFDGDDNTVLFNLMGGDYNYFEGVTFRNTGIAIEAGMKEIAGAKGLTVKHSRFENVGEAVHSDWSGTAGYYIADNDMLGRESLDYVYSWSGKPWVDRADFAERGKMKSYYAVQIYGQGHVMAYNRVRGFHDGLDHATYGMPDNYPNTPRDRLAVAIDIYNNYVSVVHDNCFEADGAMRNIRVMRNLCFNAPLGALSPQPVFGGPVYFIRNVVYNAIWGPAKIHGEPSGIYWLNNTLVGEFKQITPASNMHLRNNLLLGQGRAPRVLSVDTFTNYSSSDYNGFRPNPESKEAFAWNSPPFDQLRNFYPAHKTEGQNPTIPLIQRAFPTLKAYSKATGQDRHSKLIDYNVFVNAPQPDFSDPTHVVTPESVDLRLRKGAAAIDAGVELPNITDGFSGKAPDLGAYEYGAPLPHYGPREKKIAR